MELEVDGNSVFLEGFVNLFIASVMEGFLATVVGVFEICGIVDFCWLELNR